VIFCAGTGFAGVRREEPGYILSLSERGAIEHDASKKIRQEIAVAGKGRERGGPERSWGDGKRVAFDCLDRACGR